VKARASKSKPAAPASRAGAEKQLSSFIAKFSPEVAAVARAVLPKMRAKFRGTTELVYDNYNALAIGWSASGRTSDVICSIALYPRWVSLFFFRGTSLPDPHKRLAGSGKTIRHVVLERGAATVDDKAIQALIAAAIETAPVAPSGTGKPVLVIASVSPKQRPRRPA